MIYFRTIDAVRLQKDPCKVKDISGSGSAGRGYLMGSGRLGTLSHQISRIARAPFVDLKDSCLPDARLESGPVLSPRDQDAPDGSGQEMEEPREPDNSKSEQQTRRLYVALPVEAYAGKE